MFSTASMSISVFRSICRAICLSSVTLKQFVSFLLYNDGFLVSSSMWVNAVIRIGV